MTRTLIVTELTEMFDVDKRTVDRWVSDGCPCDGGGKGRPRKFNGEEVAAWMKARGITGAVGRPSDVAESTDPEDPLRKQKIRKETALVPDINAVSGYRFAIVTKRKYAGSIDPLATLAGTFNWWNKLMTPITSAMTLTVGTVTGNTMTITAPAFQVADPQEADRENLTTTDVKFALAAGSTPDTALTITFA